MRRWQDIEEFDDDYRDQRNAFQIQTHKEFLAAREGWLRRKMRRHELLTAKIERRAEEDAAEGARPPSIVLERLDLAMYRELSKLEAEIARELDQNIPGTAKQPDRVPPQNRTVLADALRGSEERTKENNTRMSLK